MVSFSDEFVTLGCENLGLHILSASYDRYEKMSATKQSILMADPQMRIAEATPFTIFWSPSIDFFTISTS